MPVCPGCFTVTDVVATGECRVPPCTGPASPTVPCTRTLDLRQTTTTVVANSQVCPYTPTVTQLSHCPTATPCAEADCDLLTLGNWTTDVTRYITNCRPVSTPWAQPTPPGFTPPLLPPPPPPPPYEDVPPYEDIPPYEDVPQSSWLEDPPPRRRDATRRQCWP